MCLLYFHNRVELNPNYNGNDNPSEKIVVIPDKAFQMQEEKGLYIYHNFWVEAWDREPTLIFSAG